MARPRDSRSRSPAGRYASSKRGRRNDDFYARPDKDEGRLTYRRSRSPDAELKRSSYRKRGFGPPVDRYVQSRQDDRDRDSHRARGSHRTNARDRQPRSRSPDVRDDRYHGGRGTREQERVDRRHRSRERDRDSRDERREREPRPRNDHEDGRYRPRRDERRDGHKDGHRDGRDARRDDRGSRPSTAPGTPRTPGDEESKKAEKLAKLEAWKKKRREEREKEEKAAPKDTRTISAEIGAREAKVSVPAPSAEAADADASNGDGLAPAQPGAAYAGKFDPKAFTKKATTPGGAHGALGQDIALPASAKTSAASSQPRSNGTATGKVSTSAKSNDATKMKNKGNVQAFGIGSKTQQDIERDSSKKGLDLGENEAGKRTLEKLPTLPSTNLASNGSSANANAMNEAEEDQEGGIGAAATEEEEAAIARAAAEQREERLLADSTNAGHQMNINEGQQAATTAPNAQDTTMADGDEEIDPLDAFMTSLEDKPAKKAPGLAIASSKRKQQEPEAIYSDGDDEISTMNNNPNDILEMAHKAKKKKDIPAVNHGTMSYEPFRKAFYTEPDELREMSEEETANLRLELEGIKVRGVDVPKPVRKWPHLGLGMQSLRVIQDLGYEAPTAIQSQAVPAIMSGRDVIGVAKTGSGKTVAFLLPMFRHIKDQPRLAPMDGPVGLIMTPTRELATQIHKECRPWLKALDLRAVCCYGGAPIKEQIADLKRGAEIVVCTPGRMIDLLAANAGRVTNLRRVTYMVLDEADRMFDMGFEPQVMRILNNVRPDRQTVLFSATFPPKMEALARKALTKPVEITVGGRSTVGPEIEQVVEVRPENSKFHRTLQLLGEIHQDEDARSLIFVDRQEGAEELMNAVLRRGYPCFTIHGGKDQFDRDSVISDFKAGVFPVLIATSVAARGLDVKQLKMVVNFDCPNHMEDYVHRAGRTGRAGNTGRAVTFITEDQQRYAPDIVKALKASGVAVPESLQKLADTHVENVKSGKDKAIGHGFGGKGLAEAGKRHDAEKRRMRGLFKSGDDDADTEDREVKKEDEAIVVKALNDVPKRAPGEPITSAHNPTLRGIPAGIDLDGAVKVVKTEQPAAPVSGKDRMANAAAAVEAINARLRRTGDIRGNAPIDNKGPDAGAFHATLEINDFPQKARWAVTNRTNVAKILESTGTSITSKGTFYMNGMAPGPEEPPKLYILVEGDTENVVTSAMKELMRLLKEGTAAAMESDARAPASGRYTVPS